MAQQTPGQAVEGYSLRSVIDALPANIAILDGDGTIIAVNQRWRQFAAENGFVGKDEGLGTKYVSLCDQVTGEDRDSAVRFGQDLRHILSGKLERASLEYPCHSPTEKRWFMAVAAPISRGRKTGAVVMHFDITARKDAEDALSSSEARLRSVLETAPEAIITIDGRGLINSFSPQAESLFGYKAEEVLGQNVSLLMPSPYREEHDGYIARYLTTGEPRIIGIGREVKGLRKDGMEIPIRLAVSEVPVKGERLFTGVILDLSESQLREQKLRQAQKMEAIGQLTGGIAHDFNNLLTVIVGNLEMLDARLGREGWARPLIDHAQEAAEMGADLTHRLLAFSRQQPLSPRLVDPNKLVLDMSDLLRRTLGEQIQVTTVLAPALRKAFVDLAQLQNALLNLALNARDAMPSGGTLTIETENTQLDEDYADANVGVEVGDYVAISVSDTGTGIMPEIRHRVFEPFFTTKESSEGTGLGLSMVYGFAKQSGGHLQIYSEVDKGTTVNLYLPQAKDNAGVDLVQKPSSAEPVAKGETVLVVEDEPRVRRVSCERLRQLGYVVLEAGNGIEAIDLLRRMSTIDLLFTDVVLPGGPNGRELAREARRINARLKVLYTSGYTAGAATANGLLDDGTSILRKPYRRGDLARKVREVLDE